MTDKPEISGKSQWQEWAVYCGLFLSTLDTGIVTVAMQPIATVFDVSLPIVGLTVTFYLFALIAFLVPGGWLGDHFGSERTLAAGFAIFGIASMLCSNSSTIVQLIAGRALQGLGAALIQGNALGYVAKQPPAQRLHMSTLTTAAISIGPILGPSLGGGLLELGGWPWLFLINIPFCLFGFVIAWRGHDKAPEQSGQPADLKELSAFVLLIVLAAWLLYAIDTQTSRWHVTTSAILTLTAMLGFGCYEWKHSFPLIPVKSLVARTGAFVSLGAAVFGYTAGLFFSAAPVFLISDLGSNLLIVGGITSTAPAGLFLGAMVRKLIADRVDDLRAMQLGSVLMGLAMVGFSLQAAVSNAIVFSIIAAIYGFGGGIFQVSNIKSAPKVTPDRPATAGSLLRLFQNLGIALGATVALYFLHVTDTIVGRSHLIWGTAVGALLVLLVVSVTQRNQDYES